MWLNKARAWCARWASDTERDVFEGWHDGYLRLRDPVLHRRRIVLDKAARRLTIEDALEMTGAHDVALHFHCSEHCRPQMVRGGYALRCAERTVFLALPTARDATHGVACGSVAPILGWVSRHYDSKVAAPTVMWRCRLAGATVLRSEIRC